MHYVTKRARFSACHRLHNPQLNDEENAQIYDKCNNYNGHGHNYTLQVTVCGIPNPETGYVIDLKKLKKIIYEEIIEKVDHKHLNLDVDFLQNIIPTVENLLTAFWNILESKIINGNLYRIRLFETDDSYIEYFGDREISPKL